jgi:hypothetical protein
MADREATPEPTRRRRSPACQQAIRSVVVASEMGLYLIVGVLLLATAFLVVIAATSDLVQGIQRNENLIDVGFRLLREILFLLIVAELLHSLPFVLYQGEIPSRAFSVYRPDRNGPAGSGSDRPGGALTAGGSGAHKLLVRAGPALRARSRLRCGDLPFAAQ